MRSLLGAACVAFAAGSALAQVPSHDEVTIFAAASLKESLDEVALRYRGLSGRYVRITYGSSATLAKQVEAGAPAWIFISADKDWMDYVEKAGKVVPGTRTDLLSTDLVLVAPAASKAQVDLRAGTDLAKALGTGRLAVAQVDSVPAGKYGKAALTSLGMWAGVEGRLAPAENVRGALALVARGEAPLGIVYRTDALAEKNVRIVATFPANSHPPITFVMALTQLAANQPYAARFMKFTRLPEGRAAWEKHGFRVLP